MKKKDFLFLAFASFILTVIWIASNVYHAYATSTIEPDLQIQIIPIEPSFDTTTLQMLKNRQKVTSVTKLDVTPTPSGTQPTPPLPEDLEEEEEGTLPTTQPSATPSVTQTLTPTLTLTP